MAIHKNVPRFTIKCEAIISKYKGGGICKKWATYAVLHGQDFKHYCTTHYDLLVGYSY